MADSGKEKTKYRIPTASMPPLYLMATLFDLISTGPLANDVILFVGQIAVWFMFSRFNVNVLDKKNLMWYVATWACELAWPFSIFPMFLFSTQRMIFISRREDELKSSPIARAAAAAKLLKSDTGKGIRGDMRQDRKNEKMVRDAGGGPSNNSVDTARRNRDVFKAPREKNEEQERGGNPGPAKGANDNFSGVASPDANNAVGGKGGSSPSERRVGNANDYSPEELEGMLGRRNTRTTTTVTDYGNKSPKERAEANARNVAGPRPYEDA